MWCNFFNSPPACRQGEIKRGMVSRLKTSPAFLCKATIRSEPLSYLTWILIAMASYGVMITFLKISLRNITPELALVINNLILTAAAIVWAVAKGTSFNEGLGSNKATLALLLAGVFLTISVTGFYTALSKASASQVVPIYAMNMAVAAVLGFLFLGEHASATRVAGILMAGGAIFLLTR